MTILRLNDGRSYLEPEDPCEQASSSYLMQFGTRGENGQFNLRYNEVAMIHKKFDPYYLNYL
jgi:hypothetical protein